MAEIFVAKANELPDGQWKIVQHKDNEIGVVRARDSLHAILNICPHQGGPVCAGMLIRRVEEVLGEDRTYQGMQFTEDLNIVCPWHGWEFDIETGRCAGDGRHSLRKYPVLERNGEIFVVVE